MFELEACQEESTFNKLRHHSVPFITPLSSSNLILLLIININIINDNINIISRIVNIIIGISMQLK